jgi:hypothetical protein
LPEWAIRHSTNPEKSDASWTANYRDIGSGGRVYPGVALAAYIMGSKTLWNNNAFFDYADRYMAISGGKPDPFGYTVPDEKVGNRDTGIIGIMWDTYRTRY